MTIIVVSMRMRMLIGFVSAGEDKLVDDDAGGGGGEFNLIHDLPIASFD